MSEEKTEEVQEAQQEKPGVRTLSVQEVFNQYPVDREKARDTIMMEMSSSLLRIAASLEALPQALLTISQKLDDLKRRVPGPG